MMRPFLVLKTLIALPLFCCLMACTKVPDDAIAKVGKQWITYNDLSQEAKKMAVSLNPNNVHNLLEKMIAREAALTAVLEEELLNDEELRRSVSELIVGRLMARYEKKYHPKKVSMDEVTAYYQANKAHYFHQETRKVALIKLPYQDYNRQAVNKQAKAMHAAISKETNLKQREITFSRFAAKFSAHRASRYRSGIVGHWEADDGAAVHPHLLQSVFTMEVNQMSSVIDTGQAFYLLRLVDVRPDYYDSLETVESQIRRQLSTAALLETKKAFYQTLKQRVHYKIFKDKIAAQIAPSLNVARPSLPAGPVSE